MQHPPPITRRSCRGFTLIELLVVIAIIMILASLTMSAVNRAVAQAELANCSSNLHQIGIFSMTYMKDYKNHLPHLDPGGHSLWIVNAAIPRVSKQYNLNHGIFYCPSNEWDLLKSTMSADGWSVVGAGPKVRFGYIPLGYRATYIGILSPDVELVKRFTSVGTPSQTPYYADMISFNNPQVYAHRIGGNVLMLDGHTDRRTETDAFVRYSRNADSMMPYTEFSW